MIEAVKTLIFSANGLKLTVLSRGDRKEGVRVGNSLIWSIFRIVVGENVLAAHTHTSL